MSDNCFSLLVQVVVAGGIKLTLKIHDDKIKIAHWAVSPGGRVGFRKYSDNEELS